MIHINPFMPNGISHCYQLILSISFLGLLGGIFPFYSNFDRTFCKQTVETDRGLHCLPVSTKKNASLIGVKKFEHNSGEQSRF